VNEFNPYGMSYAPQPLYQQQPPQVKIFNVNGRTGAEAFKLGPDSSIFLLDSKDPVIWMVTTDSAATKTITRIKAVIEDEPSPVDQAKEFAEDRLKGVNEKLDSVIGRLDDLERRFNSWEA